jgi:hypothetical protein
VPDYPKFNAPFQEQLDFFRRKLNLPTEAWDDIERMAHDRAFIVAGAQGADLLEDLRGAVDEAIEQGTGLGAFRKNFERIVAEHGWTGWTGEGTKGGEAWRTRVIYQTNMSTSYAAGRWKQLNDPRLLKVLPYWQYHHSDSVMHPRPLHVSWDGLTLPPDHPFWQAHFPPNGWGCMCRVTAVSKDKFMLAVANGKGPANAPAGIDGIDKGFDYAPGANATRPLKDFIDQKLIKLDAAIGAAMWDSLKPVLLAEQALAVRNMVAVAAASMEPAGASVVASVIDPATVSALSARGVTLNDAAIWLRDHELAHAIRDAKHAALPLDVWLDLPAYLDEAAVYFDTNNGTLLYAFDAPGITGKVIVRVNYTNKVRAAGKRQNIVSNFIATGGVIEKANLAESRYVRLK